MNGLNQEEWITKYPDLKRFSDKGIFISFKDAQNIKNGPYVDIGGIKIYMQFMERILNNDSYYENLLKYFTGKGPLFQLIPVKGDGHVKMPIFYDKSVIIEALEQYIQDKRNLSEKEIKRFTTLKEEISYEKYKRDHQNEIYQINIDGINYQIPVKYLFNLMDISDDDFKKSFEDKSNEKIDGILKEHLVYAATKYFEDNQLFKNILLSNDIKKRYKDILSNKIIDKEAINTFLTLEETRHQNIKLNPLVKEEILKGVPKEYSELEKAIYIYIKMCKLFTYDDEYYAVGQKGPASLKHIDPSYIESLTLEKNRAVCFELSLIYGKLLNEMGINFKICYQKDYGWGHSNLGFRTGKYLINTDFVTSILRGDLIRAKLNDTLEGIRCLNKNENTKKEFSHTLENVYHDIIYQEKGEKGTLEPETFDEIMKEYQKHTDNLKEVSLKEKMFIMLKKSDDKNLKGIDSFGYILNLQNILFTKEEQKKNFGITLIRNNEKNEEGRIRASMIFYLNPKDYNEDSEENLYFIFLPGEPLRELTKKELTEKINGGIYQRVREEYPLIPGIEKEKENTI